MKKNIAPPAMLADANLLMLKPRTVWSAYKLEHFGFLSICAYLFVEYVKPEQQYPIFSILPLLKLSVIGAIIGFLNDRTSKLSFSLMQGLILLFFFQAVVSSIAAYRPDISFDSLNILYFYVIIFTLVVALVNTEKRLFLFIIVYFLANLRMSQFGFISWVKRGFSFAGYGITGAGWYRNSGELGLLMAMFFAFTICFCFFLKSYWSGWVKWLMYFLPISAIGCVVASSSRGAVVGLAGALFYLSMFSEKKIRVFLGVFFVGIIIYQILPDEFLARFHSAGTDPSSLTRIYYWGKAKIMMREHPFFGVGYFNWSVYFGDHYFNKSLTNRVELAHNTYLQTGAELGYVGLSIFILMIVNCFYINWKSERRARIEGFVFLRSLALGMNSAGLALALSSTFLTATYLPSFWIHFSLTMCLWNIVNQRLKEVESKAPSHKSPIVAKRLSV